MNGVLLEAFRHNSWASKELLEFCRDLSPDQLKSTTIGSYGSILATFHHLITSEAGYARSLSAGQIPPIDDDAGVGDLLSSADELQSIWERLLSEDVDAEAILILDQGTYETHAGVVWAQVIHHGTLHREQICAILTTLGLEPPDLQPWAYADATGRSRWLR